MRVYALDLSQTLTASLHRRACPCRAFTAGFWQASSVTHVRYGLIADPASRSLSVKVSGVGATFGGVATRRWRRLRRLAATGASRLSMRMPLGGAMLLAVSRCGTRSTVMDPSSCTQPGNLPANCTEPLRSAVKVRVLPPLSIGLPSPTRQTRPMLGPTPVPSG